MTELKLRGKTLADRMVKQREEQKKYADKLRRDEQYKVGDLVMLSTEDLPIGQREADRSFYWTLEGDRS